MHLLYVDESGDTGLKAGASKNFILAGAAMHELQWKAITKEFNRIQAKYFPQEPTHIEFHASAIRRGRQPFRTINQETRDNLLMELYSSISAWRGGLVLFGIVIDKARVVNQIYDEALENLVTRFDRFLARAWGLPRYQNGILVFGRTSLGKTTFKLLDQFRKGGTKWTQITSIIEDPFFAERQESRPFQISDLVSNALFQRFERGNSKFFDMIINKFDKEGKKIHGLQHITTKAKNACSCPNCVQ